MDSLPANYRGTVNWIDLVASDIRDELEEVKRRFRDGVIRSPRRTLARAISQQLRDRGISQIGPQGVDVWLQRG